MTIEEHVMDTYADSYTSYQADLAYRREQLVAGLDASRARRAAGARRARRPGLGQERRSRSLARADLARGA